MKTKTAKNQPSDEKPAPKKPVNTGLGGARYPNAGGAQPGAGRPAFVPTDAERKQVEAMSGYGLPQDQIAVLVRGGIHLDTLRAHFAQELIAGKAKANSQVGRTLFQRATTGGDTTAAIWWSKTQMGWKEQKDEPPQTQPSITIVMPKDDR